MTEVLAPAGAAGEAQAARQATVVAIVESPEQATEAALRQLPPGVTGLEIRADLAGDLHPTALPRRRAGPVIYTLRSSRYGGQCAAPAPQRWPRLRAAAAGGYDQVDLEADHDLVPEVLDAVPPPQRRISWHGGPSTVTALRERLTRMTQVPAALYLLAPHARSTPEALEPLRLLASLRRSDVTAFGTGPVAAFSRVLAAWFGAPVAYGSGDGPTARELVTDYPLPQLPELAGISGFVTRKLVTSLFVRLINAGFRQLARPTLMVPFIVPDQADFDAQFWPMVAGGALAPLGLPLSALTVAAPHKLAAFAAAAAADPTASLVRAANLLLREGGPDGGQWRAVTTDGSAMLSAVHRAGPVARAPVAVVGCGNAGQATAHAFAAAGARVTLVNRDPGRGRAAATGLGLPFETLAGFDPGRYRLLIHATPITDQLPFPVDNVAPGAVIADFVCPAGTTALVAAARQQGLTTIDGRELLTHEVRQQFALMAEEPLPRSVLPEG